MLKRVNHKHIIALVGAGMREEKPHRFLVLEVRLVLVYEVLYLVCFREEAGYFAVRPRGFV